MITALLQPEELLPAVIFIALRGEGAVDDLLILSQVVLSLQLAYAVVPLIAFTSDRRKMGKFVSPRWLQAMRLSSSSRASLLIMLPLFI